MSADKTITLCDCNRTMALDAKALAHALALRSPITIHTELCRREVGAFNDALQGGDCLVACTKVGAVAPGMAMPNSRSTSTTAHQPEAISSSNEAKKKNRRWGAALIHLSPAVSSPGFG